MAEAAGYRWLRWARTQHLKGQRQAVLLTISTHANTTGKAYLTMMTIAAEAGCGITAAKKAARLLEADGFLAIDGSKGRNANAYRLGGSQLRLMAAPPAVVETEPKPEPTPPEQAGDPEAAFYNAKNRKESVAAIIDAGRAAGYELDGGRAGGFLRHQSGRSRGDMWKALIIALDSDIKGNSPLNYAEEVLKDGRTPARSRKPGGRKKSTAPTYGDAASKW